MTRMGQDPIAELEQLLRDEREAIRKLDGARVLSYAERKGALVGSLQQRRGTLSPENLRRLRAIAPALRHNSVLLAHARDILRDALRVARADLGATSPVLARPSAASPRILSVRG
jgi:hypothetical protein